MRKPFKKSDEDKVTQMVRDITGMPEDKRRKFIATILESEDGQMMSKVAGGLFELGYTGHVFEMRSPLGDRTLKITVEEVEEVEE